MPVKLKVVLDGGDDDVSRRYVLEIPEASNGHGVAVVGPADARDLIAEGRALFDQMEHQLDTAGVIETALLAKFAAPHLSASEETAAAGDGVATPPSAASAHCRGEGQPSPEEGT